MREQVFVDVYIKEDQSYGPHHEAIEFQAWYDSLHVIRYPPDGVDTLVAMLLIECRELLRNTLIIRLHITLYDH